MAIMIKQAGIWLGITVVIILVVIGLVKISNSSSPQVNKLSIPKVSKTDLGMGNPNSKLTVIEYADFQCPSCLQEYPIIKQLNNTYNGKIYFIYRFFPLIQIHKNAMASAQAAYAAYLQNKFWQMHDKLFENQNNWADLNNPTDTFVSYAKALSLNIEKFKKDMQSPSTANFINNEESAGTSAGVNAT